MSTIFEKILNVKDSSANIKYKEILIPAVLGYVVFVNKTLASSTDSEGLDAYTSRLKLLIGGGAAFSHYIKRTKKSLILETHDYDLRLYLDIKPSISPLFKPGKENVEKWMLEISSAIAVSFTKFLNEYIESLNIISTVKDSGIDVSKFQTVFRGFLTTIEYKVNGENDSLIDIVPHIPSKAIHYGALAINKSKLFEEYKQRDFGGVASRQGFFKSSLVYTKSNYGIFYVSLGYLVWDTVRMLNYIIDSGNTTKFERYLYKYKVLLSALSRPELYLSCEASQKFINNCQKTQRVCVVDDKTVETKEDLIDIGIEKGLLPDTPEWYDAFLKMDFGDICKSIIET